MHKLDPRLTALSLPDTAMPKHRTDTTTRFGDRFTRLRKAAGYTQAELADEIGVSQRMVAYYEGPDAYPPAHLLPAIAKALKVTTDELLGVASPKRAKKVGNSRLSRRLLAIEQFDAREKRQILAFLDTFIDREKLKRKVQGKSAAA